MNKLNLVGRLTRDPDISNTNNGKIIARFTVAAQRRYKNSQGQYDSDYIPCVAFEKTAELLEKYFHKGDPIGVSGHLQSGSYENKNGAKVYTLDCYVDDVEFVGNRNNSSNNSSSNNNQQAADGFMNIPDGIDMELPFN